MVNEIVATIAILSALAGATFSVARGYWSRPDGTVFSKGKLASALITSGFVTLGLINITSLVTPTANPVSVVATVITYALLGWGVDKALVGLDK